MNSEIVRFPNDAGRQLTGYLQRPMSGPVRAWALFAHCFTCTGNLPAARHIATALAQAGFGVLRFDFTGLGESEGDFADTDFSSNVADILRAAAYLANNRAAPTLLVGHSLGGTAMLQAARSLPAVRAVATIGAPADAAHLARLFGSQLERIEAEGEAQVHLAGRPFRIRRQFLQDIREQDMPGSLAKLGKALLIMHSPLDTVVDIENAGRLFQAARHPKSFVSLDRADHMLGKPADSRYAAGVIAAWASHYLQEDPAAMAEDEDHRLVVARTEAGSFRSEIRAEGHALVADEPAWVGGSDSGPSPYGLLGAALGACSSMTLQTYAKHMKWPLHATEVHVRHKKIHAEDCEECLSKDGTVDRFERIIHLEGPLLPEQRQKLLAMANRCPVHRSLTGEITVSSRLARDEPVAD